VGYTFAGWFDGANTYSEPATYPSSGTVKVNVTLTATWSANTFNIIFNSQGGSAISDSATVTGASISASPGTPTRSGFSFSGWSETSSGSVITYPYAHGQTAGFTLYAIWIPGLIVNFVSSGTSVVPLSYIGSALVKPVDPTRANYAFVKWQDSATTEISWPYTPSEPITLTAIWSGNTYQVTLQSPKATIEQVVINYKYGETTMVLPSRSRANYVFQGWYSSETGGALIGKSSATFVPTQVTVLYAQWVQASLSNIPVSDLLLAGDLRASSTQARTLIAETTSSSVSVRVPAGAFPDGTFVEVYSLNTQINTTSLVGIEGSYVVNLVVAWHTTNGLVPNATTPVVMTIKNSSIKKGANVYSILQETVKKIGVAVVDGEVVSEFTEDPLILVTNPAPVSITVVQPPAPVVVLPTIVVSSAESDAKKVETAQAQADRIIEEAKKQADAILDTAKREIKELTDAAATKVLDDANAKAAGILDAANAEAAKMLAEIKVATAKPIAEPIAKPTPKVSVKPKPTTVVPKVEPKPTVSMKPIVRTLTISCKRGNITKSVSGSEPKCPTGYVLDAGIATKATPAPNKTENTLMTITCIKGALNKKVTGTYPKCPIGFVRKR
jgi:uncharacterized repeat protein (TIGR02543 family)